MSTQFKKRWAKSVTAAAVSAALWAVAPAALATGETTGGITGSVMSQSGQAVGGVSVTVKSQDTGLERSIETDASGNYRFPQLPLGSYEVTVRRGDVVVGRQVVKVHLGGNAVAVFDVASAESGAEVIEVVGARPSVIDLESTDSGLVIGETQIDMLPVARNLSAVTMLAPGVVEGDSAFAGNGASFLPSFSGSTVGENVYYLNGFNTTNFRNGLGGSTVPFEFYKDFQIKTGGYSAEFGRSTGGVVNAVSKSGTNTFEFGMNVYHRPYISDFTGTGPNVDYLTTDPNTGNLVKARLGERERDKTVRTDLNIWAGGPIVQDKLFFFALFNPRNIETDNYTPSVFIESENSDAFWGGRLDWNISDNHTLSYTLFSDKNDTENKQRRYNPFTEVVASGAAVEFTNQRGGETNILKYTGNITDDFTISALYGKGEADLTDTSPGDVCPIVIDRRSGVNQIRGCWGNTFRGSAFDERTAMRVDFDLYLGDSHTLRFGIDQEEYDALNEQQYSGGIAYRYEVTPGRVRVRHYENNGNFSTESNSYYLQDNWKVSDTLTLELGIRNETFNNFNKDGKEFIAIDSQWAPRVGLSWDVTGNGSTKLYANYGRYYLPVATNTNVRLAGGEFFTEQYFTLTSIANEGQPNELPVLGAAQSGVTTFSDGSVKDTRQIVDQDIDPMYQDELIIGVETELSDGWKGGVRFIRRDLKQTLEDMAVDAALNSYFAQNNPNLLGNDCDHDGDIEGAELNYFACGFDYYVLGNPGQEITMNIDTDGDGVAETPVTLDAARLGYPQSERLYNALNFELSHPWDGKWALNASYTWSQSYGNNEGFVRSDNGQADAGLTTLFDQPGLTDGSYGYLPNDRRHQIKVWGSYSLTDSLIGGFNYSVFSGRPINCFGNHPTDAFAAEYGNESFYCGGQLQKRGSFGRTGWVTALDLSLQYNVKFEKGDLTLRAQVLNVFDAQNATEVVETGEEDADFQTTPSSDPTYLLPTSYQQPRRLELSAEYHF